MMYPASGPGCTSSQPSKRCQASTFLTTSGRSRCPDQKIIYIGRAKQLRRRLRQFPRHVYVRTSPHRGGQAILVLDCAKMIAWAGISDYGNAEAALMDAVRSKIGRKPLGNRIRSSVLAPIV